MAILNPKYISIGAISRRPYYLPACLLILCLLYMLITVFSSDGYGSPKDKWPQQQLCDNLININPAKLNISKPRISTNSDLVVLIVSVAEDYQSRKDIRQTWANELYSNAIKNGSVTILFVVGNSYVDTYNETATYNDVLIVDVPEHYRNLVYKGLASYRWLSIFYPTVALAKIDTDVVVKIDELYSQVLQYNVQKFWVFGKTWKNSPRRKNSNDKWFVPSEVYSEEYFPEFTSGPLYAMSAPSLRYIMQAAPNKKVVELEDVWFTGILAHSAGIPRYYNKRVYGSKLKSQYCLSDGSSTVIGYPLHNEKNRLGASDELEYLWTIPCKTTFQKFIAYFWADY